jgi:hypothetical protein
MKTPKKSESLEIRIPLATKEAFMARCRDDGRSASEAVRAFIEAELAPRPASPRRWRLIVGGLIAAAVGAAALPSLAHNGLAAPVRGFLLRSEFDRLDANRDGMVSFEEYRQATGRALP